MSPRTLIFIGIFIGGYVGAYIPALWGESGLLSMSSIIFSTLGSLVGIWAGYKISKMV
jgi:hypothetical protein